MEGIHSCGTGRCASVQISKRGKTYVLYCESVSLICNDKLKTLISNNYFMSLILIHLIHLRLIGFHLICSFTLLRIKHIKLYHLCITPPTFWHAHNYIYLSKLIGKTYSGRTQTAPYCSQECVPLRWGEHTISKIQTQQVKHTSKYMIMGIKY